MAFREFPHIPPLRGPVPLSHLFMRSFLCEGDRAVDATCGNGHDTLLLAECVGITGRVWGFDIQKSAVEETARKLAESGTADRVTLLQTGHQHMADHVEAPLKAVLFNLGYLPGGDRSIVTSPETTVVALEQSLKLLATGGIVMAVVYPGHSGGASEQEAADGWVSALEPGRYHSWRFGQMNVADEAPYCILVQKGA